MTPRYQLVFGRSRNFSVLFEEDDLKKVAEKRQLSGDLVVEVIREVTQPSEDSLWGGVVTKVHRQVVQSDCWLWDWELKDPHCYARRCQSQGWRV